jgi:Common central domain of tyrosinase
MATLFNEAKQVMTQQPPIMTTTYHEPLTRRALLRSAATITLALIAYAFLTPVGLAQDAGTIYIRKNAGSPTAKADLDALNLAIGKMKGLPCTDPTSWYYQSGIHWVPDDAANMSTLQKANPFCDSYNGTMGQLKPAWDNCTHNPGMELHFLVWHRLYIYYLEDIVRAISGKADFALPYWNYVDQKNALMPPVFANQKSNLFEPGRCTVLNQGKPIEKEEYGPGSVLDITKLMTLTAYSAFNSTIDNAPHGAMHNYIGGGTDEETLFNRIYQATLDGEGGVMAQVPSAAFDPIFWLHHAEIDYIWQQWMNSPKGQKPSLGALQKKPIPYNFFDRNGKPVTLTVEQAYNMAFSLPVTYDAFQKPANLAEVNKLMNEKAQEPDVEPVEIAHSATPQVVKGKQSTMSMKLETKANLKDMVAPESNRRVMLHLLVSFKKEPKGSYHVYLQSGADKKAASASKFIGHMTFFGAAHHALHDAANGEHKMTKNFQFDVTDQINPKTFDGNLQLVIKKNGDPRATDELTVEEQSLKLH